MKFWNEADQRDHPAFVEAHSAGYSVGISTANATIRDLEAALAPFAERCREAVRPDDADTAGVTVRTGHLRRAAEALAHRLATKEQKDG